MRTRALGVFRLESNVRAYVAELIGTFALVFFGSVSVTVFVVILGLSAPAASIIGIALTHGLVLMVMVYALGPISGCHINPAVTVAMLAARKLEPNDGIAYIVAQLLGAGIAGVAHAALLPQGVSLAFGLTVPDPVSIQGSPFKAVILEAIFTFFLVLVMFGTAVSKKASPAASGIAIGMTLTAAILIGGPLTGASLNPARTFGPAIASGFYLNLWVYFVGPIAGALIASAVATFLSKED